jgi:ADP-heptose:LPS heptosyltransferase
MKSSFYRDKWSELKSAPAGERQVRHLSRQIAYSFMDAYLKDCHYEADYIDLLCEMTTFWEDPLLNGIAAQALFSIIIESLCDDFEDLQTETYNRVMTQVISFCRGLSAGAELDRCLNDFGLHSGLDLLNRIHKIRTYGKQLSPQQHLKKIILLSRVTIGADVAITSIIIQRLARLYADAEIVLIGSKKIQDIYGGDARIKIRTVNYDRQGGLLERLASWHHVLEIIRNELSPQAAEHTILVDPDSRLSQLGVLPLISSDRYYFFDSRSDVSLNSRMSMAELTNLWLNQVTGTNDFCYPKVWLHREYIQAAKDLCDRLNKNGGCRIIAVNFGVGGNPRKTLGAKFELRLLLTILQEPQTIILLDRGSGDAELNHTGSLMKSVEEKGYTIHNAKIDACSDLDITQGIVGLETRIGEIAAIIAQCDEYIGYDSAGQHIAAAVETPCLTIFAGSNNMRFLRRWSAFGQNSCQIVHVDTLNDPHAIDIDDIIIRIMNERSIQTQ